MPAAQNELTILIRREIEAAGPISCARFMELALYHPLHGYYQQSSRKIGRHGDFYTSVSVGSLIGRLLGFQFAGVFDTWSSGVGAQGTRPLQIVEAGAHDGQLAHDILSWFRQQRPDLFSRFEYWLIEPSAAQRTAQAETLIAFSNQIRWFESWESVANASICGAIFANELLDALPVYRAGWDAAACHWFEWCVTWQQDRFLWLRAPSINSLELKAELESSPWRSLPQELLSLLPDGFTVEVHPAATAWWTQAAQRLRAGQLLTFDYGLDWEEWFVPMRQQGTLRGYHAHQPTPDPLADPGQQDITAHVNFTSVLESGERAGLRTTDYCPQSRFLSRLAGKALENLPQFGTWGEAETRQFQTLSHPAQLGAAFRALVQQK